MPARCCLPIGPVALHTQRMRTQLTVALLVIGLTATLAAQVSVKVGDRTSRHALTSE